MIPGPYGRAADSVRARSKVDVWLVEAIAEELLQALPVTTGAAPTEATPTPGAAG